MKFQEKSAWACLLSILIIWGAYFAQVLSHPGDPSSAVLPATVVAVVLQVAVLVVAHVVIATVNREGGRSDDRDRRIALRSSSWAAAVMSVGVLLCIVLLPMREIALLEAPRGHLATGIFAGPLTTGHLLLFWLVLSEVVHYGTRVLLYRRG